ncbi:MAG: M48 family metallopeptidase [Streptomycetaceae bacterium]|nr:M48 family metallopeptidase [Streptomycetaceae bacterium]
MQQSDYSAESSVEKTLEESTLPGITEGEIVVIRSSRRKKNISAYRQGGRIVVSIPARMSKADERAMVPEMVAKIRAQEAVATMSEESLQIRAGQLLTEFAPEILARPASVNWRAMRERWGSDRLKGAPEYVLDYVLFHEAIHLEYFDHGEQFKELLARFPLEAQAEAYLQGYEAAENALTAPEALKKLLNKGA